MFGKARLAFSLLLLLALVVAGCGQQITAEEIVSKVRETMENMTDVYAEVTVDVDIQGMQGAGTVEVWEKSPSQIRIHVLESTESQYVGVQMVSDGKVASLYDPRANQVLVGPLADLELPLPAELLGPVQELVQQVLDATTIELVGEEEIAGQPTYKLSLESSEDPSDGVLPGNGTATLWVDKERWFVLKATYEASSLGQGSIEILSLAVNTGLDDELFRLASPEDAKIVELETQKPQHITIQEAQEGTEYHLLVPTDTLGATLIDVFRHGEWIVLNYDHSSEASFSIMQGADLPLQPPQGASQPVQLRGQEGSAVVDEVGNNTFLSWTEEGITITIAGHIGLEEAVQVAESMQ
jgi:outer membrane lipoprotein-sorting protein